MALKCYFITRPAGSVHCLSLLACSWLGGLGWEEEHVDVGQNTTAGDGGAAQQLGELLVVADSELDVAGHNSALLVVAGSVAGELEDLSSEVLKDGSKVHWGTSTNAFGVSAMLQEAGNSANWERKSCLGGS